MGLQRTCSSIISDYKDLAKALQLTGQNKVESAP